MARYSKCSGCGEKTDNWFGTGNIKLGPCCSKADAMFLFGIKNQKDLNSWYEKFRPGKTAPSIKFAEELK